MSHRKTHTSDSDEDFRRELQHLMEYEEPVPEDLTERLAEAALEAHRPPLEAIDFGSDIRGKTRVASVVAASLALTVVGRGLELPMSLLMGAALLLFTVAYALTVENLIRM